MYGHQKGKLGILTSTAAYHSERHMLIPGANASIDAGLVLSTDAKPRLKWTQDLHDRFIDAVNQLGGADKATPKSIMKQMGIPGLTLYHLKSHLQKYRLSKNVHSQENSGPCKSASAGRQPDLSGALMSNPIPSSTNRSLQIGEALEMQIEVQKRLHEQLEVQRHLQLRIEAQGKYLQSVLEKAQETLGKHSSGLAGLYGAREKLSELFFDMSNGCLDSRFPGFQGFIAQRHQHTDGSIDSCLTSSEGTLKDQEGQRIKMKQGTNDFPMCMSHNGPNGNNNIRYSWADTSNQCKKWPSSVGKDAEDLSMSTTAERGEGSDRGDTVYGVRGREKDEEKFYDDQKILAFDQSRHVNSRTFGQGMSAEFDLNSDERSETHNFKLLDLNGFSWG